MAIAALIISIIGLIISIIGLGGYVSLLGLIFGLVSLFMKKENKTDKDILMSKISIGLSVTGVVISVIWAVGFIMSQM